MKQITLIIALSLMVSSLIAKDNKGFSKDNATWRWRIINDGVMGGLSQGKFKLSDQRTGVFEGNLSLDNNGGFTWVRTAKGDPDFSGSEGLIVRIKGDGRTYGLTLDTSNQYNAFSFNHYFETKKDEWMEIKIPYNQFKAVWFGRKVPMLRISNPKNIKDVGFILMDKKAGAFRLEIESVTTY